MTALVLTLVVALGWVGAVALGYWHGGWRQIIALAGILLSYAVLSEWAGPNGRDLAAQFGWPLASATPVVALLYLIVGTAILGVLGGMLLPRPAPLSAVERGLGALVGFLDGGLLLALALRIVRSYAFAPGEGQALRDSLLARFLIEQVGYLLMAAFVVGLGAVVAGLVLSRRPVAAVVENAAPVTATVTPIPNAGPVFTAPAAPAPALAAVPEYGSGYPLAAAPVAADPYSAALDIDWPANPPPGMPVLPVASPVPPPAAPLMPQHAPAAVLPMALHLPPRVAPPLWHPVAALTGAERMPATITPPVVSEPAMAEGADAAPPPSPVPPSSAPPIRPAMPPGVPFVPPAAIVVPERPPSEEPIVVHERDMQTHDSAPAAIAPMAAAVVDVPAMPAATSETVAEPSPADLSAPDHAPVGMATEPEANISIEGAGESAMAAAPEPPAAPPAPAESPVQPERPPETAVTTTAPIPAIALTVPPLLPPPTIVGEQRPRNASFARVAQPRQPEPPASPPPSPAKERGPLRPPLPTGPDIYGCPTCGYPVRRHTRYCPNCGTRLRH